MASEIPTMGKSYGCQYDAKSVTWSTTVPEDVAMKAENRTAKIVYSIRKNDKKGEKRKPNK